MTSQFESELRRQFERQVWFTGCSATVVSNGKIVLSLDLGEDAVGRDLEPTSLHPVYCAGKPLLGFAVLEQIRIGELSLEDRLSDVVADPLSADIAPITIGQLLSHRAGLGDSSIGVFALNADRRRSLARTHRVRPRFAGRTLYSETIAWELLALAIEDLTGDPFDHHVRTILTPLGVEAHYRIDNATLADQVRVTAFLDRNGRRVPHLWETAPSNLRDSRPGTGLYCTTAMIARVLDHLSRDPFWLSHLAMPEQSDWDPQLKRTCRFSMGCMVDLSEHSYSDMHGPRSFGHTGLAGMTIAAADPDLELSYAVHLNGVTGFAQRGGLDERPDLRRKYLSELIVSEAW